MTNFDLRCEILESLYNLGYIIAGNRDKDTVIARILQIQDYGSFIGIKARVCVNNNVYSLEQEYDANVFLCSARDGELVELLYSDLQEI